MNSPGSHDRISRYMDKYMIEAIEEAKKAASKGEVPIGAVVVRDGEIIARDHNRMHELGDPTAHAEMLAIREAAKVMGGWRLVGCSMYVTVEPCSMCAGAMVWARIDDLYIGTMDERAGACGSVVNLLDQDSFNHKVNIHTGIMQEECADIITDFFKQIRKEQHK